MTGKTILRWLPPAAWMGVIFTFSSLTGSELEPVSAFSTYGHLGEYAILGVLLAIAATRTRALTKAGVLALAIASAYGVTDELHQFLTPGRMPDPRDWLADTAGAAAGIAVVLAVVAVRRSSRGT